MQRIVARPFLVSSPLESVIEQAKVLPEAQTAPSAPPKVPPPAINAYFMVPVGALPDAIKLSNSAEGAPAAPVKQLAFAIATPLLAFTVLAA